jgi:hypothetical protein
MLARAVPDCWRTAATALATKRPTTAPAPAPAPGPPPRPLPRPLAPPPRLIIFVFFLSMFQISFQKICNFFWSFVKILCPGGVENDSINSEFLNN